MATWTLAATLDGDALSVTATGPAGEHVRFGAWKSHLDGLTAAQKKAYLATRIKELTTPAPSATALPTSIDIP